MESRAWHLSLSLTRSSGLASSTRKCHATRIKCIKHRCTYWSITSTWERSPSRISRKATSNFAPPVSPSTQEKPSRGLRPIPPWAQRSFKKKQTHPTQQRGTITITSTRKSWQKNACDEHLLTWLQTPFSQLKTKLSEKRTSTLTLWPVAKEMKSFIGWTASWRRLPWRQTPRSLFSRSSRKITSFKLSSNYGRRTYLSLSLTSLRNVPSANYKKWRTIALLRRTKTRHSSARQMKALNFITLMLRKRGMRGTRQFYDRHLHRRRDGQTLRRWSLSMKILGIRTR